MTISEMENSVGKRKYKRVLSRAAAQCMRTSINNATLMHYENMHVPNNATRWDKMGTQERKSTHFSKS